MQNIWNAKKCLFSAAKTSSASFVAQSVCSSHCQTFLFFFCNFSGTSFVVKILVIIVIIVLVINISLDVCQIEPAERVITKMDTWIQFVSFFLTLKHNEEYMETRDNDLGTGGAL